MKSYFRIEGRLIGMNDVIAAYCSHRMKGHSLKRKETNRCSFEILRSGLRDFKNPVKVTIRWVEPNNKRDIDNIAGGGTKCILDALCETGRLQNDTRAWVKELHHIFPTPEPANPHVMVDIEEV